MAYKVFVGSKDSTGVLRVEFVLRICGVWSARAEELTVFSKRPETKTVKVKSLLCWDN